MMGKIALYFNTIKYLKIEQLWFQVWKRMGFKCALIKGYKPELDNDSIRIIPAISALDFDNEFLNRFSVEGLMENHITLLHSSEILDLNGNWFFDSRSPLWNHNLHYFEYLFSLAKAYKDTNEIKYFEKIKEYILSWVNNNPIGSKNSAWECYPIALRIPNWIDLYSLLCEEINEDKEFKEIFIKSIFEQYVYLLNHLEKHLLANHYFEDLRTLVIASIFLGDDKVFKVALKKLLEQCQEQILQDGMHYERSPMYQKILLEDLIRVESALEFVGKKNEEIRFYIKKMLDVSYSFENKMERLPLFNDCGKNIAKSLESLIQACANIGISPEQKKSFPNSGYFIVNFGEKEEWRMIIDAGQPGPNYSPGHSHCETMSFELFFEGKPVIVNSGTFAYQSSQRKYFKSTEAHNTVCIKNIDQSEYWSNFRMARRARIIDIQVEPYTIMMSIKDYKGNILKRNINIEKKFIKIEDESDGNEITSFLHFADEEIIKKIQINEGNLEELKLPYAEEFGTQREIKAYKTYNVGKINYSINL